MPWPITTTRSVSGSSGKTLTTPKLRRKWSLCSTTAVRLDPKLATGYLQLGILSSDRKDFSQAISDYQKAIEANPRLEEAHYRLAQAYRRTGDKSKAQQELQLYEQLSKKTEEEVERQRHEIQQFVYTLRDPASP